MRILITLLSSLCLLAGCATRDNYTSNIQYMAENHETETHLGMRYLTGRGLPQNDQKAFSHLLAAADHGDPIAQNEVGYLYAVGRGTAQNDAKAMQYYSQAAAQHLASAQYSLGLFYQYGLGIDANQETACRFFLASKQAGFDPAKQAFLKYCEH